jgi:hypothetical protein
MARPEVPGRKRWCLGGRRRLGDPPVLDPVSDLKLHQLDLVEAIHERQALLQARGAAPRLTQRSPGAAQRPAP